MNTNVRGIISGLLLGAVLLNPVSSYAEEAKVDSGDENSRSGGYLKIGYGYKYEETPFHDKKDGGALFLSGRYQFENGIYIEASHGANELSIGNSVGYNFYNTEHWSFDLHGMQAHGSTEMGFGFNNGNSENTDIEILHMDGKYTRMLGLRTTGTYDQATIQFIFAPYSFNDEYDDGIFASAWIGRSWQLKNWELHALVGVTYRSEEINNYYYSTSDEIIAKNEPQLGPYQADGGFDVVTQVGVSYPVSKNVLFESYLRYTDVSDEVSQSPVMRAFSKIDGRAENVTEFGFLFSYVF